MYTYVGSDIAFIVFLKKYAEHSFTRLVKHFYNTVEYNYYIIDKSK